MKNPDRFARRAKNELATPWELNQPRLAMLIRAEHNAVVRLVKAELAYRVERNRAPNEVTDVSGISACNDLLAALARRSK